MVRVVVSFLVGTVVAFAAVHLLGRVALAAVEGAPETAADRRQMTVGEYQRWLDSRYELPVMLAALAGGLACGMACGLAAVRIGAAPDRPAGAPLTRDEQRQAVACCLWADLRGRTPEYLQGLIVGRLAESEPALARKIDALGHDQAGELLRKALRRKSAVV
jgi:hypothetical protein